MPFWLAAAIAINFTSYQNALSEGRTLRFGVAMGLEGTGKGTKPRLVNEKLLMRDLQLALAVLLKVNEGSNATTAAENVASEFCVSREVAWRVWTDNKEFVTQCLANFKSLSSPR